jgi:hypothetical protein
MESLADEMEQQREMQRIAGLNPLTMPSATSDWFNIDEIN